MDSDRQLRGRTVRTPKQKSEEPVDAKRWMERIRFLVTEPAIHGEVLKADGVAQGELAKAIAERTGVRRRTGHVSVNCSGRGNAVVGIVVERWLRHDPSCSIVPLMCKAFDIWSPAASSETWRGLAEDPSS
jgi:hypothetical protein